MKRFTFGAPVLLKAVKAPPDPMAIEALARTAFGPARIKLPPVMVRTPPAVLAPSRVTVPVPSLVTVAVTPVVIGPRTRILPAPP